MAINQVFSLLATCATIYSVLCTIRIILTWIPGLSNGFTDFLRTICDPYLNFFSRRGLFRFGALDFSPILSLGILSILSTLFASLANSGRIALSTVLVLLLQMTWNTVSSIVNIFTIFLVIRFVVVLINHTSYTSSSFWTKFDYLINPFIYKVARFFSGGKMLSHKTSLLITIILIIVLTILGFILVGQLSKLILLLPV